jgi:capsid protein
LHWFDQFRPGQVRGIPTFSPSLDLFAELRAYRRAVVRAAETAADFAAVLEQELGAAGLGDEGAELEPFKRVPISRGMMAALPPGTRMHQFDAKQPTTSYAQFAEQCLGEAVRPLSYPLNLALGTSQKFNFSSAKLDHTNYRANITTDRLRCAAVCLRPLFRAWFEEAVLCGAIRPWDGLRVPPAEWHWPGFESIDPLVDAQTDAARIAGGTLTLREFWARRGADWRDVLVQLRDEKQAMERYGLQFGAIVQRSLSETQEPGAESDADAETEPTNAV